MRYFLLFLLSNILFNIAFSQPDLIQTELETSLIKDNKIKSMKSYFVDCDNFIRFRELESKVYYDSCGNDTLYEVYDGDVKTRVYRYLYQYDSNCKIIKCQEYLGNKILKIIHYDYDEQSNCNHMSIDDKAQSVNNDYKYFYEGNKMIREEKRSIDIDQIITYKYDDNHKLLEETHFSFNPIDTLKCFYNYNQLGKKIKEVWKSSNNDSEEIFLFDYKRNNRIIIELFFVDNILTEKYITKFNKYGMEYKLIEIDVEDGKKVEKTVSKYSKKINNFK